MRTPTAILTAILLAATLPLAACGNDEAASSATSLAPAGALMYGEVSLEPEGDQKAAIDAIVSKFPGEGPAGERLKGLIEQGLKASDAPITFKDDIEPWLGDTAAFFLSDEGKGAQLQDGAALIATDDEDAARDAVEKSFDKKPEEKSYKDVDYLTDGDGAVAVFDGFVVAGSERGVKTAIDTSDGGSPLEDDNAYTKAVSSAAEDRLGLFYINAPALFDFVQQSAAGTGVPLGGALKDALEEPYVATVDADQDGVTVEAEIPEAFSQALPFFAPGNDLVSDLPADSWLALGQPDLGKVVDYYVTSVASALGGRDVVERQFQSATGLRLKEDVLDWMGDFAVFVRGASVPELGGALVVETSDPAATERFIARLRALAGRGNQSGTSVGPLGVPGGTGFTVRDSDVPQPVHVFLQDDRFVVAYGDDAAKDAISPSETLGSSPEFSDATQSLDGYDVSFYLAIDQVLSLAESSGAGSDPDYQEAKPYLDPLGAMIGGTKGSGDDLQSAFKITVK